MHIYSSINDVLLDNLVLAADVNVDALEKWKYQSRPVSDALLQIVGWSTNGDARYTVPYITISAPLRQRLMQQTVAQEGHHGRVLA